MIATAKAAREFFDARPGKPAAGDFPAVVNGFTGSSIWHSLYAFPPTSQEFWEKGFRDFAARVGPDPRGLRGEQRQLRRSRCIPPRSPSTLASAQRAVDAVKGHRRFGFNYDPSHLGYQGVDYVKFIRAFGKRIFHVHMKDVWWGHGDGSVGVFGGHTSFGDPRRYWDFRSLGHGDIRFEDIIVALNDVGYRGPLSVEWEDIRMDRVHGATEAAAFVRKARLPAERGGLRRRVRAPAPMNRKLRFGMVGGGPGAFIGAVHRLAAQMDGAAELVAGAFSSDPARSRAEGRELLLDPARVYGSYAAMAAAEAAMPPDRRLDFVVDRHPQRPAFPGRETVSRARLQRGLRQAGHLQPRRGEEAAGDRAADGQGVRPHPQLHRQRDGEAGARAGARRPPRHDPQGRRRIPPGLASRRASRPPARNRPSGAPTRSAAAPPAASATSGPTPRTSPATSPGCTSSRSAPTSRPLSPAAGSTTTAASSCVTAAAPKA